MLSSTQNASRRPSPNFGSPPPYMPKMTLLPFLQICLTLLRESADVGDLPSSLLCAFLFGHHVKAFFPKLDKLLTTLQRCTSVQYDCQQTLVSLPLAQARRAHESDAPEYMTVVIFLHPLLVSVLHHLSDAKGWYVHIHGLLQSTDSQMTCWVSLARRPRE